MIISITLEIHNMHYLILTKISKISHLISTFIILLAKSVQQIFATKY